MKTHREIAQQLDLFHSEPQGPGMLFWHPNGWRLFQNIQQHMRKIYQQHGFQEVRTPQFLKKELWQTSGHLAMYEEDMFFGGDQEGMQNYALKPMSCPAHILLFKRGVHSYRELPIKLFEFGLVHRNEPSGALNGCLRLRQFTQDDAHVFCAWSQIQAEIIHFLNRAKLVYSQYGYHQLLVRISTRPESSLGDKVLWQKAEQILIDVCQEQSIDFEIQVGEGAFYGPKIELALKDNMSREWQCGTIQLDFNLPERFDIAYTNASGEKERPVILHQVIYGSIERWIGMLLEVTQGALPEWIHPLPVAIATVSESAIDYANALVCSLNAADFPVLADHSNSSVSHKIRRFHQLKIPNILIVGEQEMKTEQVALRRGKTVSNVGKDLLIERLMACRNI
ncbi:threonine--tRNA ligase [Xenorhabdus innexi]|uniref:Threonine--tRNA ligase n=1 Tax=Xenorhabdus innexi TaxID=290109 RepID=A0A1N6MXP0_9GAMM|nr:threonine--tRNA ligase [Xenorhabdus innexi]PHM29460.1 proline--tRNA ligase [Xenorhabdus innexi]SIP73544.1 tRNA synthetase class II (G H P and S) [Xenorhabdus innexi]